MRLSLSLFVLSALTLMGSGPAAAQKEKEPAPQNDKLAAFVDDTPSFKGKEVTFRGTYTNRSGLDRLRDRIGEEGVPIEVKAANGKVKSFVGVTIPKDFPREKVPNAAHGEEVIVTFYCGEGKIGRGNKVLSVRRAE